MASIGRSFDPQDGDTDQRDFENVPDGDYVLEIEKSDVTPTSAGNGTILKLTHNILEPEAFKSRKIFGNINIENVNAQAQEIGQRDLRALCRAIGHSEVLEDTEVLHFRSFTAKVGLSKARTGNNGTTYPPRNEIKKYYFPDEGNVPAAKALPIAANDNRQAANDNRPAPEQASPVAAQAGKKRPWGK